MSKFWNPIVKCLMPYESGEQPKTNNLVKLNTNENSYGPSPLAITAMANELCDNLRLYPDPHATLLKNIIADRYNLTIAQILLAIAQMKYWLMHSKVY